MNNITSDTKLQGEILEGKDVIASVLDKSTLETALSTIKKGEKLGAKAKVGSAVDIGLGIISAGEDIQKSVKDGKLELAGDNFFQRAGNLASVGASVVETAGLVDPMLMPLGVGLELGSDIMNFMGDREKTDSQISSSIRNNKTITPAVPKNIPDLKQVGRINILNNNILNKAIS